MDPSAAYKEFWTSYDSYKMGKKDVFNLLCICACMCNDVCDKIRTAYVSQFSPSAMYVFQWNSGHQAQLLTEHLSIPERWVF